MLQANNNLNPQKHDELNACGAGMAVMLLNDKVDKSVQVGGKAGRKGHR